LSIPLLHSRLIPYVSSIALEYFRGVAGAHIITRVKILESVIKAQQAGLFNLVAVMPEAVIPWKLDSLVRYRDLIRDELSVRYPNFYDCSPITFQNGEEVIPGFNAVRSYERSLDLATEAFPETNCQFLASIGQAKRMGIFHGGRVTPTIEAFLEVVEGLDEESRIAARILLEKEFQTDGQS